jgi:outer membrane receptor protein involved in Fe transport
MFSVKLSFVLVLTLVTIYSFAQGGGKITGTVVNASSNASIEYASVSLIDAQSQKALNGTITDARGNFILSNVAPGKYTIKVEFVGFKPTSLTYVMTGAWKVNMGPIELNPASASLKEVTVTASRPLVENHIDKIVFNAANDLTSQSGVALDVLKKVPSVSVDVDGNVELEGNSNVRFLINGKPSTIFGSSLVDALQSIPASQIKSIEAISSPGAKYDATGTGGIINIILKDNKVKGINGSVNLSAGTRLENGALNLNIRRNNFGINAFFSGNEQLNTTRILSTNRQSFNSTKDTLTGLQQNGNSDFKRAGYQTGLNFDWDVSPKDKLTASFNWNHFGNNTAGITNQQQEVNNNSGHLLSSVNSAINAGSKISENAGDWSLSYKKLFNKKGQELNVLATTSKGNNHSDYYQQQYYSTTGYANSGSRGNSPGNDRETNLSVDYRLPLGKSFTLETGGKAVFERLGTIVSTDTLLPGGGYGNNANQTYAFTYNRKIYAYYVSTEFSLFHEFIEGQAGLRYEYTATTEDFKGAAIPSYGLFFPSILLSHHIDETQTIKAVFSSRIERPDYGDLNPFYNISDPHNISTGNPNLRPEKGHRYELGYNKTFGHGSSLYVAALYRRNTDDIQAFSTYYSVLDVNGSTYTDVSLTQRYNIGSQSAYGLNMFGSVSVTPGFSLRSNIQLGEQTNSSPGLGSVSGVQFRANMNASYKFPNKFMVEIFGNYNASQKNIQGLRPAFGFYTLALRKEFFHDKASFGFTATNPFNKYVNQRSTLSGSNFMQSSLRKVPYQSFGITLSYKFGKLEFKGKERDNNSGPAPIE